MNDDDRSKQSAVWDFLKLFGLVAGVLVLAWLVMKAIEGLF